MGWPGCGAEAAVAEDGPVSARRRPEVMPSAVDEHVGWFDRFAGRASLLVSRAWFFAVCVVMVLVWVPSYFLFGSVDTWQLVINTGTTIVTYLLVALLQNAQQRSDQATQHKLNAVADALSELMRATANVDELDADEHDRLQDSIRELCAAVGLEERESTS